MDRGGQALGQADDRQRKFVYLTGFNNMLILIQSGS